VATQEQIIHAQYLDLLKSFKSAFPNISSPAPEWWSLWMAKHSFRSILGEIRDLSRHPLKDKFCTASVGRALSARLRDKAFERAILDAPVDPPEPGGQS
jgi:hypothetical protein